LREALHRIARLRYGGPERARELVRRLRRMRRMADVARKKARFPPSRFDRAVVPESPVEAHHGEHEQKEQEAEEREQRSRIERADRGNNAVTAEPAGAVIRVQILAAVRSTRGVIWIGARVAGA